MVTAASMGAKATIGISLGLGNTIMALMDVLASVLVFEPVCQAQKRLWI